MTDFVEILEERGTGDITEDEKEEFLELTRLGLNRREAALSLGYTARPWRALTSPQSRFYDEAFANAYAEAKGSPEARMNYIERLRDEIERRALTDSDRLLEKLGMVHLPEWAILRQKDVSISARLVFEQHLKGVSTSTLKQLLRELDDEVVQDDYARELTEGEDDEHDSS